MYVQGLAENGNTEHYIQNIYANKTEIRKLCENTYNG